jgi:acyl-coenzyme A synthetase/AMP-(fatty) acid ligase
MSRAVIAAKRADGKLLMPGLRVLVSTTGKLQPEERVEVRRLVAPDLIDYYGSTATGPIAILDRIEDEKDPTAVGRFVLGMQVEVADEAGNAIGQGDVGRIRVRGPAVSSPVQGAEEAVGEGYHDGWFYPGDLGSVDAGGVLHIHGRAADLIKRGGLMVHAQEVEQALRRHPGVTDAAVVGAPSADLGQEVVAFVIANVPLEIKEIIQHCRREIAPYKIPVRVFFVDDLPRNANGKVVKGDLLKRLAEGKETDPVGPSTKKTPAQ